LHQTNSPKDKIQSVNVFAAQLNSVSIGYHGAAKMTSILTRRTTMHIGHCTFKIKDAGAGSQGIVELTRQNITKRIHSCMNNII
jgi:hypothetical protein